MALCRFFNGKYAIHAALLSNFVMFAYTLHRPPRANEETYSMASFVDKSVHVYPAAILHNPNLVFLIFLLTAASLHNVLHRKSTAFLDIACVPQEDAAGKAQGIERLGAVLARSERMILLVDEHYWRRLWCVFEVAAFCRHSDVSRLVVLPLHTAQKELGFMVFWQAIINLLLSLGANSMAKEDHGSPLTPHLISMIAACLVFQPIVLLTIVNGRRSRNALHALRDFSIADAQCYSAEDREALTAVICNWYTDHRAGEDDPERLMELGRHKFETFVRHNLAPSIERQEANDVGRQVITTMVCGILPAFLMNFTAPSVTLPHAAVTLTIASFIGLLQIIVFWAYELGASVILHLVERVVPRLTTPATLMRRFLTAVVYLLGFMATAAIVPFGVALRMLLSTPNLILAPAWRFPSDDGLDAETRRFAKQWVVLAHHMVGIAVYLSAGR